MSSVKHDSIRSSGQHLKRRATEQLDELNFAKAEWNTLRIRPLGAGQEVGRSCIILTFKGKTIMLDCGILPSFRGEDSLPLLREIEPADIDIVIITYVDNSLWSS